MLPTPPPLAERELSPQVELGAEFKRESPRSPDVAPPTRSEGASALSSARQVRPATWGRGRSWGRQRLQRGRRGIV